MSKVQQIAKYFWCRHYKRSFYYSRGIYWGHNSSNLELFALNSMNVYRPRAAARSAEQPCSVGAGAVGRSQPCGTGAWRGRQHWLVVSSSSTRTHSANTAQTHSKLSNHHFSQQQTIIEDSYKSLLYYSCSNAGISFFYLPQIARRKLCIIMYKFHL